ALSSASLTPRRPPSSPLFPYTTLFRSTGLDLEGLPVAALLGRSLVVPLAPPWPSRMFFPPLHRRHDSTHGRQGTRAGAHHAQARSEEHTSELQSLTNLVCRLLLEKKKK